MTDRSTAPPGSDEQRPPPGQKLLDESLRDLGGTFLRIGHHLALRPDVVPPQVQQRLLRLGQHVPPVPWSAISDGLAGGTSPFASVNARATTSTTFHQVHEGELLDGTRVAIKVLRGDARLTLGRDLQRATVLESLLVASGARFGTPFKDLLHELTGWLEEELDLARELANIERLREAAVESKWEDVPRPYPALSSDRMMVTESLDGIPAAVLLMAVGSGRLTDSERLRDERIAPVKLARDITLVNLRQIFRYRFFQADWHPQNVVRLPSGRITFVDFAHFGVVDVPLSERQLSYLAAIFDDDLERMLDPPVDVASSAHDGDLVGFRRHLVKSARARVTWRATPGEGEPGTSADTGLSAATELIAEFQYASRAHCVGLAHEAHLLYRSVFSAQQTSNLIEPCADVDTLTVEFLHTLQLEVAVRRLRPSSLQPTMLSLLGLARDSPRQLQKLLSDLADGSFVLNVYSSEAPQVARNRDRRTRVVVGAICSVSVALLLTSPNLPHPFGLSIGWLLSPLLAMLYAWIYLQWRRLR